MTQPMFDPLHTVEKSLDFNTFWTADHVCHAHQTEWRVLPYLVIHYTSESVYRCAYKEAGSTEERTVDATRGQALLIPPGLMHQMHLFQTCETSNIGIKYSMLGGMDPLSLYRLPLLVSADQASALKELLDKFAALSEVDNQLDIAVLSRKRALALELLAQVIELSEPLPDGRKRILAFEGLRPALDYIDAHYTEKVTTTLLADLCSLSRQRFSALFKESIGCPPHQYILRLRIEEAMSLLGFSDLPVADVAEKLGFFDQPHFTKLFSSLTGLTPTHYRCAIRKEVAKV